MTIVTEKMIGIESKIGLPVEEGEYGGDAKEYIVFDYADERGELFGDNEAQTVTSYMQIRVRLKKETAYSDTKRRLWEYLETEGFYDIGFESYCQKDTDGVYRYLVFECSYTGQKGE